VSEPLTVMIVPVTPDDLLRESAGTTLAQKVLPCSRLWGKNPRALLLEPSELDLVLAALHKAGVDVGAF